MLYSLLRALMTTRTQWKRQQQSLMRRLRLRPLLLAYRLHSQAAG